MSSETITRIDELERELARHALAFRSSSEGSTERDEAVANYHRVLKSLMETGGWCGTPDLDSQLPDEFMPQLYKDYWSESDQSGNGSIKTEDLRTMLEQLLEELDNYPLVGSGTGGDEELELQTGHPLCDMGRRVVRAIPDSKLDRKGTPNFPSTGGKLWHRLLRTSRTTRDELLLEKTANELSHWIRQHYKSVLEDRKALGDHSITFDTLLSHNSQDKPIVRKLADTLVARGLRPWLDERELVPGRPWQEALEEIIQTTKTAAVLFGPAGLGPWEEPEMRACLSEFVKRKLPVIPVLLPGAPQQPELPLFLKAFTWVDLRGGLIEDGLDRLVWGITGVKPASLPSPAGSAPHPPVTTESESGPLATWKEKLEYLQEQEAITADPAQKFALKKQTEEAQQKIRQLGG